MSPDIGNGIARGLAITLIGVVSLALLGGYRNSVSDTAYATITRGTNLEVLLALIVFIGVITTIVYHFAHD